VSHDHGGRGAVLRADGVVLPAGREHAVRRPHPFISPSLTPHHSFYYTPEQRIAVTGGTTCLQNDVPYDGNQIEFRTCAVGDNQQLFTLEDVQATVTSTTAFPDPTTICHNGIQQILTPANYVNATQTVRSAGVCASAFG
jgi:hypothetical protein